MKLEEKLVRITQNWLVVLLCLSTLAMPGLAAEKWQTDMQKDFAKVLREKKKPAEKHREFIVKWEKRKRLDAVLTLYAAEEANRSNDAVFFYGFGYAHALHATRTKGEFGTAVTHFQRALAIAPNLFWAHFNLGGVYQQQNLHGLALEEFSICVALNPNYYPVYYRMGEIYLIAGDTAEARTAFETAQQLNRKWAYPRYGLGLVAFAEGDMNGARETFERLIQQKKKFSPAYFKLGQVLATEGFFDAALEEYAKGAKYQPYSAQTVVELADIFRDGGNAPGALQLYQRALEIEPANAPVHFSLAALLYTEGDVATDIGTAVHHYRQALSLMPSLENALFEPILPYFAGEMSAAAAKAHLEKATAVLPDDARVSFYTGMLEADVGNVEGAIESYKKTLERLAAEPRYREMELPFGQFNDIYLSLGELYHQQGNVETASTYFQRAIELNPALADRFLELGQDAFDAADFQHAIEPLNTHLLLFPEDIAATYLLGQSYEALGDTDNALRFYKRTLALDAARPDVLFKMVHIYREQNAHREVVDALKQIIALEPDNAEAHFLSAQSYLALNQPDAALAAFLETTRVTPDNVTAHYQAGILFEQKDDIDNAIVQYENTIALDKTNAAPFFRLSTLYQQRNDEENLIRVAPPALELEPNHPELHYRLAGIFERWGEAPDAAADAWQRALHHYKLANHYAPENFAWHYQYARLLDRHAARIGEEYHEPAALAVTEYTTTLALNEAYVDAYYYRGMLTLRYRQIGATLYRYSQILEDFKQVVELQPRNLEAHYTLGVIYLEIERHRLAKAAFEKVLSRAPNYRGAHLHLGKIAEWAQDWKGAIAQYEAEAALINPDEADDIARNTYQNLGELYYAHALDYNAAKETLEKAIALDDSHVPTLLNYGNTLFSMDLLGVATEQFERVIQLQPGNFTANYNLALMYEYREKTELARAQWKRFLSLNPPEQWKREAEKHLRELGIE